MNLRSKYEGYAFNQLELLFKNANISPEKKTVIGEILLEKFPDQAAGLGIVGEEPAPVVVPESTLVANPITETPPQPAPVVEPTPVVVETPVVTETPESIGEAAVEVLTPAKPASKTKKTKEPVQPRGKFLAFTENQEGYELLIGTNVQVLDKTGAVIDTGSITKQNTYENRTHLKYYSVKGENKSYVLTQARLTVVA